jgi:3-oxoacyl-[acyl-carrier protein] reductase
MERTKIVLVTGSSRGLGRGIAVRLADDAAGVAVHYLSRHEEARKTAADVLKRGAQAVIFCADLMEERQAAALIRAVEREFGRVDILVNTVGPMIMKPWDRVSGREWISIYKANLLSALSCMKAVLPGMRKRGFGRIINFGYGRVEQLAAFPTIAPYAAAKTGLLILTRTAAVSERSAGITVNMVSPGLIEGGRLPAGKNIPEASLGRFEDVAEAVAFLASEEAGRITGTDIIVAGTWKM